VSISLKTKIREKVVQYFNELIRGFMIEEEKRRGRNLRKRKKTYA